MNRNFGIGFVYKRTTSDFPRSVSCPKWPKMSIFWNDFYSRERFTLDVDVAAHTYFYMAREVYGGCINAIEVGQKEAV